MPKKTKNSDDFLQCEAFRKRGGAFSFGHVSWDQCQNRAKYNIAVEQEGQASAKVLNSCGDCTREAFTDPFVKVIKAELIALPDNNAATTEERTCHCGADYTARKSDLERGRATSCSKSCVAKKRAIAKVSGNGKPVASPPTHVTYRRRMIGDFD